MLWFKGNKKMPKETDHQHDNRVQIIVHKNATKDVVEQAKLANQHLNDLLLDNGFTLTINLAMGAKTKRKLKHGH